MDTKVITDNSGASKLSVRWRRHQRLGTALLVLTLAGCAQIPKKPLVEGHTTAIPTAPTTHQHLMALFFRLPSRFILVISHYLKIGDREILAIH